MSVFVQFHCDECFAKSEHVRVTDKFVGISGRSHGFGSRVEQKVSDVAPEGWITFDLIGCTYCPECAGSLRQNPGNKKAPEGAEVSK